jgi:predicted phosphoribosyltransferase
MMPFKDRRDAGRKLAARLSAYGRQALVLSLPRGGVPVAFEIAQALGAALDVLVVRKLGAPDQPELALGAIAGGDARVLNDEVVRALHIADEAIETIAEQERQELIRREKLYRGDRVPVAARGRDVILVDDGLATGASMRAALHAVRQHDPARVVIAVPVAAPDVCAAFRNEADAIVCLETPEPFLGVGRWYEVFAQTSDDEVRELLAQRV